MFHIRIYYLFYVSIDHETFSFNRLSWKGTLRITWRFAWRLAPMHHPGKALALRLQLYKVGYFPDLKKLPVIVINHQITLFTSYYLLSKNVKKLQVKINSSLFVSAFVCSFLICGSHNLKVLICV